MIEHIPISLQGITAKELKQILYDYLDEYFLKRVLEWDSLYGKTLSFFQRRVNGESNEEIIKRCINKVKNSIEIADSFELWLAVIKELRDAAMLTQNTKDKFLFSDGSPALSSETFHALANIIICVLETSEDFEKHFALKIDAELEEIQKNTTLLAKNNLGSGMGADGYRGLIEKHQINLGNLGYIPALNWLIEHKVPTFLNSPRGNEVLKKYNCEGKANCDLPMFYQVFFGQHYFNSSLTSTKFPEFDGLVWEAKRKASHKKEETTSSYASHLKFLTQTRGDAVVGIVPMPIASTSDKNDLENVDVSVKNVSALTAPTSTEYAQPKRKR